MRKSGLKKVSTNLVIISKKIYFYGMDILAYTKLAVALSIIAIAGTVYCILIIRQSNIIKRRGYRKEIDNYYDNMSHLGYKDNEIAEMLHQFETPDQLRNNNKSANQIIVRKR